MQQDEVVHDGTGFAEPIALDAGRSPVHDTAFLPRRLTPRMSLFVEAFNTRPGLGDTRNWIETLIKRRDHDCRL
jgi:hypothetical protein